MCRASSLALLVCLLLMAVHGSSIGTKAHMNHESAHTSLKFSAPTRGNQTTTSTVVDVSNQVAATISFSVIYGVLLLTTAAMLVYHIYTHKSHLTDSSCLWSSSLAVAVSLLHCLFWSIDPFASRGIMSPYVSDIVLLHSADTMFCVSWLYFVYWFVTSNYFFAKSAMLPTRVVSIVYGVAVTVLLLLHLVAILIGALSDSYKTYVSVTMDLQSVFVGATTYVVIFFALGQTCRLVRRKRFIIAVVTVLAILVSGLLVAMRIRVKTQAEITTSDWLIVHSITVSFMVTVVVGCLCVIYATPLSDEMILAQSVRSEQRRLLTGETIIPALDFGFVDFEREGETDADDTAKMISIECFEKDKVGRGFYVLFSILSVGILPLLSRWFPRLEIALCWRPCELSVSHSLVITADDKTITFVSLQRLPRCSDAIILAPYAEGEEILLFEYRCVRFYFSSTQNRFLKMRFDSAQSYSYIHDRWGRGLTVDQHVQRLALFGPCQTDVPVLSNVSLLLAEVLNPFYIFQIFSVILWLFFEEYIVYAVTILIMSIVSAVTSFIETKQNLMNLRNMAHFECTVTVHRSRINGNASVSNRFSISSEDLVVGDLIEVNSMMTLPCDLILLSGSAIVNESVLTGESIPVIKSRLPHVSTAQTSSGQHELKYSVDDDKNFTLYAGTKVIQVRAESSVHGNEENKDATADGRPVYALVVRTGYATVKGQLIKSILFPRPTKFKFDEDSYKFIACMFGVSAIGLVISVYFLVKYEFDASTIIIRCLDLVTIAVPPALPAAMTVSIAFAVARMKRKDIFCISPHCVNVAGTVDTLCFDKTGTLTTDGLDVEGVLPVTAAGKFDELNKSLNRLDGSLAYALACCHSIAHVGAELVGDPLDVKMFEATGWSLDSHSAAHTVSRPSSLANGPDNCDRIEMLRLFDFSSKLQRMSVIARHYPDKSLHLYVKGSPEMIGRLCVASSLPSNYQSILSSYTKQGYRILALASKQLTSDLIHVDSESTMRKDIHRLTRDIVETDLYFLGFLIMENKLKPDSSGIIDILTRARIKSIMVTGDNVLTAVSVSKQCHILSQVSGVRTFVGDVEKDAVTGNDVLVWMEEVEPDHESTQSVKQITHPPSSASIFDSIQSTDSVPDSFPVWANLVQQRQPVNLAVTGKAYAMLVHNYPLEPLNINKKSSNHLLRLVLVTCRVFARMSPDQKTHLVNSLQKLDLVVAMCGDGSNDCGALKAASAGVSLSTADASIAAPFTSKRPTIAAVIKVLREGRASLVTSFQVFKFMALYSLVQFVAVIALYSIGYNLSDYQFLFQDLVIIIPFAILMSRTGAYKKLSKQRPTSSLMSSTVIVSVVGQLAFTILFQMLAVAFVRGQSFYTPPIITNGREEDVPPSYEGTVIFLVSCSQLISMVLAFNISKPFRKPLYTNKPFGITICLILALEFALILDATSFLQWLRNILEMKDLPYPFRLYLFLWIVFSMAVNWIYEAVVPVWLLTKLRLLWRRCSSSRRTELKDE